MSHRQGAPPYVAGLARPPGQIARARSDDEDIGPTLRRSSTIHCLVQETIWPKIKTRDKMMDKNPERAAQPRTKEYRNFHKLAKTLVSVTKGQMDELLAKERKVQKKKARATIAESLK